MEGEPDYKDRIAKIRKISWKTTRKLGDSKEVNGNNKKSYEETIL